MASVSPMSSVSNLVTPDPVIPYPFFGEKHAMAFTPEAYEAILMRYYDVLMHVAVPAEAFVSGSSAADTTASSCSPGRWSASNRRKRGKRRAAGSVRSAASGVSASSGYSGSSGFGVGVNLPGGLAAIPGRCYEQLFADGQIPDLGLSPTFSEILDDANFVKLSMEKLAACKVTRSAVGLYHVNQEHGPTALVTLAALAGDLGSGSVANRALRKVAIPAGIKGRLSLGDRLGAIACLLQDCHSESLNGAGEPECCYTMRVLDAALGREAVVSYARMSSSRGSLSRPCNLVMAGSGYSGTTVGVRELGEGVSWVGGGGPVDLVAGPRLGPFGEVALRVEDLDSCLVQILMVGGQYLSSISQIDVGTGWEAVSPEADAWYVFVGDVHVRVRLKEQVGAPVLEVYRPSMRDVEQLVASGDFSWTDFCWGGRFWNVD